MGSNQWLTFDATAYTAGPESTGKSPGDADYGITASGRHVRENHTIACPKSIALDTRMEIEGLGVRTCDDRGGAITDGRLDIYFEDVADAREFGRRTVRARIIEN
ncbi:3D domain-containing protein [Mesobacillus zeae]|uniref:3D domain-containing protein n=1 Tax=Mesobacillus zeae TaxID=1917180 RepID=UPI0039F0A1B3